MTNEEIGKFAQGITEILERLQEQIKLLDLSIDKKIVADLAWLKLVESTNYTEEMKDTSNAIIKQTKEALDLASNAGEEMSKQLIELGYYCKKWIEEHADS